MKYPESQALFTRLLIEAGFQKECGQFDKKRFCQITGMSPRMCKHYLEGQSSISVARIKEIAKKVGLATFNII